MIGRAKRPTRWITWSAALLLAGVAADARARETVVDEPAGDEPVAAVPVPQTAAAALDAAAEAPLPLPFELTPELARIGQRLGRTPGGTKEKADAIVDFVFLDPEGLRFEYRRHPTLTAEEAFEQRAGNCLTLVNLFIALGRAAGLDAFPIEVEDWAVFSRQDGAVVRSTHVISGLNVGGYARFGQLWTIDFLPGREKAYRKLARIGDARHAALHYNSVAVEAMFAGDPAKAERMFRHALSLAPDSAEAWSNYAVLARRQGELPTAIERLEEALARERDFLPALNNMSSFLRLAGRIEAARRFEQRALEARFQNPYFLIDQAIRRLQRDELDEAYALLQRARRIDATIPEVYLALGRADLARGRVERAERHFATARARSQEASPAFREGIDRKIDKLLHLAAG